MSTAAKLAILISQREYYRKVMGIRATAPITWGLWESAGRTAVDRSLKVAPTIDFVDNGGFETAGGGGADVFANWFENASTGAIADETTLVHGGAHAAKLTAGTTRETYIQAHPSNAVTTGLVDVIPGMLMTLTFWTRGDGTYAGQYNVYDATNAADIKAKGSTGVTGTDYTLVTYSFTIPAGCYQIRVIVQCPATNGGIAYFDDVSLTCSNQPYSGRYTAAGMTYGVEGIGDGHGAARFSGSDTGLLIGSKAFGQIWDGNVGSTIAWGRADGAARWTDAAAYRYLFHAKSRQNATAYLAMGKNQTDHQLAWRRRCVASLPYDQTYTFSPTGPTTWFCQGFTWDVSSTPKRCAGYVYAPGHTAWVKVFDEAPTIGNETWVNANYTCDDKETVLAGGNLTAQEWIGDEVLCFYWPGVALTEAEMQRVMTPTRG